MQQGYLKWLSVIDKLLDLIGRSRDRDRHQLLLSELYLKKIYLSSQPDLSYDRRTDEH